jgi:hypothetical protein
VSIHKDYIVKKNSYSIVEHSVVVWREINLATSELSPVSGFDSSALTIGLRVIRWG